MTRSARVSHHHIISQMIRVYELHLTGALISSLQQPGLPALIISYSIHTLRRQREGCRLRRAAIGGMEPAMEAGWS